MPSEFDIYNLGNDYPVAPAVGTPSPPSPDSGGILASLGSSVQGISNIGLQWFTAITKGVTGPLATPQPVQATPGAATANVLNQLTGYLPLILLLVAGVVIVKMFVKH